MIKLVSKQKKYAFQNKRPQCSIDMCHNLAQSSSVRAGRDNHTHILIPMKISQVTNSKSASVTKVVCTTELIEHIE